MLGVDQDGVFGLGGFDPFARVFDSAGILRYGDDLEILVLQLTVKLLPSWQIQAGSSDAGAKGNIVWKAPAQPGSYEVSLIVSDGVIRAMRTVVLDVRGSTVNP